MTILVLSTLYKANESTKCKEYSLQLYLLVTNTSQRRSYNEERGSNKVIGRGGNIGN